MTPRAKQAAAGAGVAYAAVLLGCGWFLFASRGDAAKSARSAKRDASAVDALLRDSSSVFPSQEAIADARKEAEEREAACKDIVALASRMSVVPPPLSPAQFRTELQTEIEHLRTLKNAKDKPVAAQGFGFGFEEYLDGRKTLSDADRADVPALQRQLVDISYLCGMAAGVRVEEIKSVKGLDPAKPQTVARTPGKPLRMRYEIRVAASPRALAEMINRLSLDQNRFTVIDRLDFKPVEDVIKERIEERENAKKKLADEESRARRVGVRPGRKDANDAKVADVFAPGRRIAFDPAVEGTLDATMAVSVYDFGILAAASDGGAEKAPEAGAENAAPRAEPEDSPEGEK